MAGPFDDAANNVNQQRAAALNALATGGSAGLKQWQDEQAATQADKASAVKAALASAVGLGAPAGAGAELQASLSQPFDQYAATSGALTKAFSDASATRQQGAKTFFDETAAAVPVIKALADKQVAGIRARAAAAAQAKALSTAQANRGFAGTGVSESEVKAAAIGKAQSDLAAAQQQADQLQSQIAGRTTDIRNSAYSLGTSDTAVGNRTASGAALDAGTSTDPRLVALHNQLVGVQQQAAKAAADLAAAKAMPDYQRQQQAAASLGVPSDIALGMFPAPTPQQQVSQTRAEALLNNVDASGVPRLPPAPASAAAVRATPDYSTGMQAAKDARGQNITFSQFVTKFLAVPANAQLPDDVLLTIFNDAKGLGWPSTAG